MVYGAPKCSVHLLSLIHIYQSMDNIVRKIMEIAADAGILPPAAVGERSGNVHFIGIYTPVSRCLQTTFSFILGQLLARRHKMCIRDSGEAVCSSSGNIISFVYASANDYGDWTELYQI